jgi:hypothetical protein
LSGVASVTNQPARTWGKIRLGKRKKGRGIKKEEQGGKRDNKREEKKDSKRIKKKERVEKMIKGTEIDQKERIERPVFAQRKFIVKQ